MPDSILGDLKSVGDEMLYRRLAALHQRFPAELPAVDYVYRCDIWEMAHKAVRAEIKRRNAPPPPWWPLQEPVLPPARRPRWSVAVVCLATVAGVTVLFGPLALAVAATVSAAGARVWWVARAAAPKDRAAGRMPR